MNPRFKVHRFRQSRQRDPGASAFCGYDPSLLEVESAYYSHCETFPEDPSAPRIIVAPCREKFLMPVTAEDVETTLSRVPARFLRGLQAIFLLSGTRKQEKSASGNTFGYGCYWENCVFLHPYPLSLLRSVYIIPPKPSELIEYARVGAEITTETEGTVIRFDAQSLKRLYLQDVLIHEIGHHVDQANLGNTKDDEAYANWFATEFGFRRLRRERRAALRSRN